MGSKFRENCIQNDPISRRYDQKTQVKQGNDGLCTPVPSRQPLAPCDFLGLGQDDVPQLLCRAVSPEPGQRLIHACRRGLTLVVDRVHAAARFADAAPSHFEAALERNTVTRSTTLAGRKAGTCRVKEVHLGALVDGRPDQRAQQVCHANQDLHTEALGVTCDAALDDTRDVVHEAHAGCARERLLNLLEKKSLRGSKLIAAFAQRKADAGEVVEVDGALAGGGHDADDAAQGCGALEKGQKVEDEADAGVHTQRGGERDAF